MTDQWDSAEMAEWLRRYIETERAASQRLAKTINEAFYGLVRLHRSTGLSFGQSAQAAIDSLNEAMRKPSDDPAFAKRSHGAGSPDA